ncbi:MAG: hypothetical protein JWQ69_5290 [Pseudomonas sp.]|nr:hypothetical protein [Pseudomonas sp.]
MVYPDYIGKDKKRHDGHIGIVVDVNGMGISGVKKIIHCSLGASTKLGDAIQVTDASIWTNHADSIIVWLDGMEP